MSTYKTEVDQDVVLALINNIYSTDVSNLVAIRGGEGSQAFSFHVKDEERVIRVRRHNILGFKKDEYASLNYSSLAAPVPRIFKIGQIDQNLGFCVSAKVPGKPLNSFSTRALESLHAAIFDALVAIHSTDIKTKQGYGEWDAEGEGGALSWQDHLLNVDKYVRGVPGRPNLFETTCLERKFWNESYKQFVALASVCPEERFLVHGDYLFSNIVSDGNTITGVIDWEMSVYGDFLFDVARLSFWSPNVDYASQYCQHLRTRGVHVKHLVHFAERILCYKLFIGLESMSFYAFSGQTEKYAKARTAVSRLLEGISS